MRHRVLWLLCSLIVLLAGCRIRDYMVPWIVDGELSKMASERAHRSDCIARVSRQDATVEVHFTVDFMPPDRLRWDFLSPAQVQGIVVSASTEMYVLYDPSSHRAERIRGLPPFSTETFREFRQLALRKALSQSEVYVESARLKETDHWLVRTKPKKNSLWSHESFSYVTKDTKNNVWAFEKDPGGRVINELVTTGRDYRVEWTADHFRIPLPGDVRLVDIDLSTTLPFGGPTGLTPEYVPTAFDDMTLHCARETSDERLYVYTERQRVFFYFERQSEDGTLLTSPIAREVALKGCTGYLEYIGSYTILRWRQGGKDRLVFTSLGPEIAVSYASGIADTFPPALPPEVGRQATGELPAVGSDSSP